MPNASPPPDPSADPDVPGSKSDIEALLHPHVRVALATWPQIDPAVEAIVNQVHDAEKLLAAQMRDSLAHFELTIEEFKVLIALRVGPANARLAMPGAARSRRGP